jgi:signal transduction histidine kinase
MASIDDGRGPALGRLRFPDALEAAYVEAYLPQALPRARFALVLAVALFALFGILDAFLLPEEATRIWLIRFGIVCPLGLAVLGLSFSRRFVPIMQWTLSAFAVIGGLGIVAMIAIADPPGAYQYYAGLVLVIFWIFTLLQLRFPYATGACLAIVVGYEVVAIWVNETPVEILLSNNFFFLSAAILGVAAGYTIEQGKRTGFLQRRLIERQRAELADRNVELDSALRDSLEEVRRQAGELRASRARIVVAGDVERRRIERNLHDGAQQQLVSLAVQLTVAESYVGGDEQALRDLLFQVKCRAQEALTELRDLARGIYPPLLADHGLVAALEAQAQKVPLPVEIRGRDVGRYPSEVEAAVYFSVLEALQNVVKYANATTTVVVLSGLEGRLWFEVRDDGTGFDPDRVTHGIGLQSMQDRLQALGGTLEVRSAPGEGTSIRGTVPAGAALDERSPELATVDERSPAVS